jgi:addiction module HigA family antidote
MTSRRESTPESLPPITPGDLLREEFLEPMGISVPQLAEAIDVPVQLLEDVLAGNRIITTDLDALLCSFFGLSDGYWIRSHAASID